VARGVAGSVYEGKTVVGNQGAGVWEWVEWGIQVEKGRLESGWIELFQCTGGAFPFFSIEKDGGLGEMAETAGVIEVQVGEDDGFYRRDRDVEFYQLLIDAIVGSYAKPELGSHVSCYCEARGFEITRAADGGVEAGVDDKGAIGVFDDQYPDGDPLREAAVKDGVEDRKFVAEAGLAKSCFVESLTGGNQVEAQRPAGCGGVDSDGGEHVTGLQILFF